MSEQVFNLRLVAEVKKNPCLYNFNLPEYTRKDITEETWFEIGRKLNLTGHECKERWKNIRAVFVRHLKPSPTNKILKPYYLSEAMQFTLPFVKTLKQYHRASASDVQKQEIESDQENSLETSINLQPSPCSSPVSHPELPSPQPSIPWGKGVKRSLESDPLEEIGVRDMQEGANKMFLLSVLPDMNMMTPSQLRTFKKRVMESVVDILEDNKQ